MYSATCISSQQLTTVKQMSGSVLLVQVTISATIYSIQHIYLVFLGKKMLVSLHVFSSNT